MLVARNTEGELLKIPVPMHYLYVFVAGALIGMLTITGMLGSTPDGSKDAAFQPASRRTESPEITILSA